MPAHQISYTKMDSEIVPENNFNMDLNEVYEYVIEKVDESHVHRFESIEDALQWLTSDINLKNSTIIESSQTEYYSSASNDSSNSYYASNKSNSNEEINNNNINHQLNTVCTINSDDDDESEYIDVVGSPIKENAINYNLHINRFNASYQNRKINQNHRTTLHSDNIWDHMYSNHSAYSKYQSIRKMNSIPKMVEKESMLMMRRKCEKSPKRLKRTSSPVFYDCPTCCQRYQRKHCFERHVEKHRLGNKINPRGKRSRINSKDLNKNVLDVMIQDL